MEEKESVIERIIEPLGRRFFWVKSTGNIIAQRTCRELGVESTKEQDFAIYLELQGYDPNAIEMTTLEYEDREEDFKQAIFWTFDPETGDLLFQYPEPNEDGEEPLDPVLRKPLSLQVAELEQKISTQEEVTLSLMDAVLTLTGRV